MRATGNFTGVCGVMVEEAKKGTFFMDRIGVKKASSFCL